MSRILHDDRKLGLFDKLKAGVCFRFFPRRSLNAVFDILEHISGYGCTIDKKPIGNPNWKIIVDPPMAGKEEWPALFTVKYEGGYSYMWLPECDDFGPANYLLLNGSFDNVSASGITPSVDGWVRVGQTGPFFLVAQCQLVKESGEWKAKAQISIAGSASEQDGAIAIPLAYVDGSGTVLQLHVGIASIVFGISQKTRSVSRIYYDGVNKQIRTVIAEKTYERGVCVHVEDDSSSASSADEEIVAYLDECSCESSSG